MKRIVVIGIGSLIMRDDGVGSRVVDAIESSLREHDIAAFVGETDFQCCGSNQTGGTRLSSTPPQSKEPGRWTSCF